MKKNEFLQGVVSSFLSTHSKWSAIHKNPQRHYFAVGRQLPTVLVYLDFDARSDAEVFGQGVGWTRDRESLLTDLARTTNPEFKATDGRLSRLRTLECPRDFAHEELRIPTFSLIRPISGYRLSQMTREAVHKQMLAEIDELALPYLCMMLKARHGVDVTPEQLGNADIS